MLTFRNHPFPPILENIYDADLANQLAATHGAISALNPISRIIHNPNLLIRPILAKEAESSSQLEGTQASIEDAFQIDVTEQSEEKRNEALEIRNYEEAMLTGLDILRKTKSGVNELLIRETHKRLLHGVRGQKKNPGKYRSDEVWIGKRGTNRSEARYIPPDATQIQPLMEGLIRFINNRQGLHPLIACGVMHHRFEAIHPFKDGNGRVGRLLISLYLIDQKLLNLPILYPSGHFETHRNKYIDTLSEIDKNQSWHRWLMFFLKALETQAGTAGQIALNIDNLFKTSKATIEKERANLNLIRVLEFTFTHPYITSTTLNSQLEIPRTTCDRYLKKLSDKKVIKFMGIHKRSNVFVNRKLIDLLIKV